MPVIRANIARDKALVFNKPVVSLDSPFLRNLPRIAVAATTKHSMRQGEKSLVVSMVQAALAYSATHAGPVQNRGLAADGIFGGKTREAVVRFQRHWNLGVDGIVGPETLLMIETLTMR